MNLDTEGLHNTLSLLAEVNARRVAKELYVVKLVLIPWGMMDIHTLHVFLETADGVIAEWSTQEANSDFWKEIREEVDKLRPDQA